MSGWRERKLLDIAAEDSDATRPDLRSAKPAAGIYGLSSADRPSPRDSDAQAIGYGGRATDGIGRGFPDARGWASRQCRTEGNSSATS